MRRLMIRGMMMGAIGALGLGLASAAYAADEKTDKSKEEIKVPTQSKQDAGAAGAAGAVDAQEVQKVMGADVKIIDLNSLDKQQLMSLQRELSNRGYYHGKIDGTASHTTTAALKEFLEKRYEMSKKLLEQNKVPGDVAGALGVNVAELQPVRGHEPAPASPQGKKADPQEMPMDEPTPAPAPEQPAQPEGGPY